MASQKLSDKQIRNRKAPPRQAPPALGTAEKLALARDGIGWFLCSLTGVAALALFSHVYGAEGANWMGPYLGTALADSLQILCGRLPALLFIVALGMSGLSLLLWSLFPRLVRVTIGLWSSYFFVSLLLSLRIADLPAHGRVHYEQNGGIFGMFVVRNMVEPLFGAALLGPVLFSVAGLLLTAVLAFGLRQRHLEPLARAAVVAAKALRERLQGLRLPSLPVKVPGLSPTPTAVVPHDADTGDFAVIRKGEVSPFKGPVGKLDRSRVRRPKGEEESSLVLPVSPPRPGPETVDAIRAIEMQLKVATDPREVRRLRDELVDLRRIQGINEWEDDRPESPQIVGMVRRKEGNEPSRPATAAAPAVPVDLFAPPAESTRAPVVRAEESSPEPVLPKVEPMELSSYDEYRVPRVSDILGVPPEQEVDYSEEELQDISHQLEVQLENFRVKGKVTGIATGPVITRFEIEPGPGVKVSRFAGLADDLALSLRASAIRVLAPIPGKSVVGIEIPNRKAQTVFCRDILESERFAPKPENIQVVLGKDITGNAFVMDLSRAPHILIAGQTGSGKSVCINVLMASILLSKSPDELRMILVDPKVVELKMYEKIPHLLAPVVTQPEVAVQALKWACWEMDRRYNVLASAKVRNIAGFNQKFKAGDLDESVDGEDRKHMPFIVIVIDELADLMMVAGKEVETSIARIAQKARAVGIHLVLATQRPSVNVITGLIKANLPTRISFKVASHIDARTILDRAGSEKLLGRGDMLYRATEDPEPHRVHGAFLSDSEAETLADACSSQNVKYELLESFEVAEAGDLGEDGGAGDPAEIDSLFFDAAELGIASGGISTSMVQRRFQVGYSRAGRIVDQMERMGICSKANGSKPRNMLIDEEQLMNLMRTWNK